MIMDIVNLGGYGQFVWPAFIFTFVSCFLLYLRTKKEFQKQEKMFINEFKQLHTVKIKTVKTKEATKEATKEVLSGSSV